MHAPATCDPEQFCLGLHVSPEHHRLGRDLAGNRADHCDRAAVAGDVGSLCGSRSPLRFRFGDSEGGLRSLHVLPGNNALLIQTGLARVDLACQPGLGRCGTAVSGHGGGIQAVDQGQHVANGHGVTEVAVDPGHDAGSASHHRGFGARQGFDPSGREDFRINPAASDRLDRDAGGRQVGLGNPDFSGRGLLRFARCGRSGRSRNRRRMVRFHMPISAACAQGARNQGKQQQGGKLELPGFQADHFVSPNAI